MRYGKREVWVVALVLGLIGALNAAGAGGFGGYGIGMAFPGISALKTRLQAHGLELQPPMMVQGGQGYGFAGKLILGGFGFGGSLRAENPDLIAELSGGGGGFEIGRIHKAGPGWVALMATLGGFGYMLTLRPKLEDVDFDSLIAHPRRVARIGTGSPMLGVSGMAVFPVVSFFSLGVKAGAYFLPMAEKWILEDGATVFNAPKLDPLTYSVQLMLLFGGFKPAR